MKKIIILFIVAVTVFTLASCSPPGSIRREGGSKRGNIVSTANKYVGVPYKSGGATPRGFDCSGFVLYVYKQNRINMPRTAEAQYKSGKKISAKSLRPGDLVFFQTSGKRISHVGIYLGKGRFVHAPGTGKKTSYASLANVYWKKHYRGAATYL